jgi:proliferating cell nuclear antigen
MSENLMKLSTIQIKEMKILVEALKEVLIEANLVFDKKGLKIADVNREKTLFVNMRLHADEFEEFECQEDQLVVPINMKQLFNLFKLIKNTDVLSFYIKNKEDNHLNIQTTNQDTGVVRNMKICKLDANYDPMELNDDINNDCRIDMDSNEFRNICSNYNNFSDKLKIICSDNKLKLSCRSENNHTDICSIYDFSDSKKDHSIVQKDSAKVLHGLFFIKYFNCFSKCSELCETIRIQFTNDMPLTLIYEIGALGQLKVLIANTNE